MNLIIYFIFIFDKDYKQNRIKYINFTFSLTCFSFIILGFSLFFLLSFHVNELNCLCSMLIPNLSEHCLKDILVFWQSICVVIVKVEPYFSSETHRWWILWWYESESVQFFRHLKIFTHQIKDKSFIDFITLIWFWYLEHKSSTILVFRMFPTRFNSLLEKFDWVDFSWSLVDFISTMV